MGLAFDQLEMRATGDAQLARFGTGFDCALLIGEGDNDWLVRIEHGVVRAVRKGPHVMPRTDFSLRAEAATWAKFCEPVPPPGYHDLFALRRYRRIRIEGDIAKLSAYLFYVKRLFELLRPARS